MISRRTLRGKPLDTDCYKARTSSNEYGAEDKRTFCRGLMDCRTEEMLQKCRECKANVINAEAPKEADHEDS